MKVSSGEEAQKLSNLLKDGNWMVLYYADWCGHCQQMKPEWQKVISSSSKSPQFNIADIESTHIAEMPNKPTIEGFPTIKMYNFGKEVANFQDERNADKIKQFAISNSKVRVGAKPKTMKNMNLDSPLVKLISNAPRRLPTLKHKKHHMLMAPPVPGAPIHKKAHHHKKHKSVSRSKKAKKSKSKSKTQSQKQTTTDVFQQLIKSFKRIGNEAKKDSDLLKTATKKL